MSDAGGRPTRHVVFSPSARASLLDALKMLGRRDDVVALFDDLQSGPLDLANLRARERWFNEVLGYDVTDLFIPQDHEEFWRQALDLSHRLVAWTTRYATRDRIGFLAWASQLRGKQAEVVDISDVIFEGVAWAHPSGRGRLPIALLSPANFIDMKLFDLARPMTGAECLAAADEFRRLKEEDGAFRSVRHGELISLPLTAFDDRLIAKTSATLWKAARVIGEVLADMDEQDGWGIGDHVLAARLCALVENGRLEAAGDVYGSIRYGEVSLPQTER